MNLKGINASTFCLSASALWFRSHKTFSVFYDCFVFIFTPDTKHKMLYF